ncbi:phosphotransferase family protein [Dietzia sp. SLG310A2-38A2]|uniref:choline/ethanolamine kinase family protein n=1 Tax=Dietzia sp. SLG310A2-38A2 TaxID=1630643 RepID=UPI0015F887C1|nr:choline/ethanolamine kinase family protein [Dietzia sp. SLG310A2-38A2]MBB1032530.1 phosphotransferase family protein [Dietzia sp. SLG310A2-38A2]
MTTTTLGAASTPAEHEAERHIRHVAEWTGRDVSYEPVVGGLQNSNWLVHVGGDDVRYFLKVPGDGTDAFIDRHVANIAAERAGAMGISPRVAHFDSGTGTEISEFLEGYRACTNGDMKSWDTTRDVLGLYDRFHTIPALPLTKTMFDLVDEHLEQARTLQVRLPDFAHTLVREYARARAALHASGLDLVPCHNDPMPGNFLVAEGGPMKLVDFEFASNNDRAYDLALILAEFFYDEPTSLRCIEEAYGHTGWSTVARVQVCRFIADLKWGLWGCVNHQLNSTWDFDYHKYGVLKLFRARGQMNDPRWSQWLGAL